MKYLIIRLSSIGDILLTTPVVRALKKQQPDSEVHFLTRESNLSMLVTNPYIDRVITVERHLDSKTRKALKQEGYDMVIDLHNNRDSRRVRHSLRCKSVTYKKENFNKFLYVLTKHNFMSGRHVVDRYFDAVKPLGVKPDGGGLDVFLPDNYKGDELAKEKAGHRLVGEILAEPYIAVACGAQHATKRIPFDKLRQLCTSMNLHVVLLGDEHDRKRMRDWGLHFDRTRVYNLCGRTSLMLSAALVSHAEVVITPDTAIMHIAAAFGKPVIAIWGATSPEFGFSAYNTKHADCVVEGLWCHPCSRMGGKRCPLGHYNCMNLQKWQRIAETASRLAVSGSGSDGIRP